MPKESNQQILEKAIAKAIEGGWDELEDRELNYDLEGKANNFISSVWYIEFDDQELQDWPVAFSISDIIFSHDFAKALWGEQKALENGEYPSEVIMYEGKPIWHPWQYHLQQMVIADDPIKYLGENI